MFSAFFFPLALASFEVVLVKLVSLYNPPFVRRGTLSQVYDQVSRFFRTPETLSGFLLLATSTHAALLIVNVSFLWVVSFLLVRNYSWLTDFFQSLCC
jgi:hypothetical protein